MAMTDTKLSKDAKRDDEGLSSPGRRAIVVSGGLAALSLGVGGKADAAPDAKTASGKAIPPPAEQPPLPAGGRSPWGYETTTQATPQPAGIRPHEASLPSEPRPYTDIKSYHAHIYFDEDTFEKAVRLRDWVAERFEVELGDWNDTPRGPHVTPSFYFGFTNNLLHVLVPWLQLNSLGLTILLHPNTDDPRSDHLYYTLWINRSQPVNGYGMKGGGHDPQPVELIYPNTKPTKKIEV